MKNTAQIVKATLQGSKCVRNVIVTNIEDICSDLRKCLAQQDTPLGFLPISNLKRDPTKYLMTTTLIQYGVIRK